MSTTGPIGSTEIWLTPGGDFVQQENGDLLLAQDTAFTSDATIQRIQRLLLTNARLVSENGTPISAPGDLFNPNYGASLPALVDQPVTQAFINQLQARIQSALTTDPTISQNPAPSVSVSQTDPGTGQVSTTSVFVTISAQTVAGQTVVVPSFPIPLTS